MLKKSLLIALLLTPVSVIADEVAQLKQQALDLIFTERFVKKGGEISAAKIPFRMKVKTVHSSCSTFQRLVQGANMCPVGVEGEVLEFAPEEKWTVTVWAKDGVSNYGEDFEFSKIKHLMNLREETRNLAQSKMAKTTRKFYHATGTEEDVNKLIYKSRKKLDDSENTLIVHGIFWANVKPEYVEYERYSDYKGVDIVYASFNDRKEAGEALEAFGSNSQTHKFEELYSK